MKNTTLLFLVKKDEDTITDICLAMKKRGFGAGRYNGAGGKVEEGETVEQAVTREVKEEMGVDVLDCLKVGELIFLFPHKEEWNQLVHIYITENWEGEVEETEEMNPKWFRRGDIPYETMWSDDILWLPYVLEGKYVSGDVTFGEGDVIVSHDIKIKEV